MPCFKCFYQPWCDEGQMAVERWAKVQSVTHGHFEEDEFVDLFSMKTFYKNF